MKNVPLKSAREFMLKSLQTAYCIDYNDFCDAMYDSCKDYYTMGKFKDMQKSYLRWFCDLDEEHQNRWVSHIINRGV